MKLLENKYKIFKEAGEKNTLYIHTYMQGTDDSNDHELLIRNHDG